MRRGLDRKSQIECTTYHSLARKIITNADPQWWELQNTKAQEFWEEDIPLKLIEVLDVHPDKFDAIIIDEGQDFKPIWLDTLQQLLPTNSTQNHFAVFLDYNQDIFNRHGNRPEWSNNYAIKHLRKNCRNSKSVSYTHLTLPTICSV